MFNVFRKQPKNKQFGYIPQHYDPVKEERKARLGLYEDSEISDVEKTKSRIQSNFKRRARGGGMDTTKAKKQSNIRLIIIIGILLMISYYFLQSEGLRKMLESFE